MAENQTTAVVLSNSRELDLLDPNQMTGALKLAELMSTAAGWVPKHLLGNQGACLGIVSLSAAWRVNPFLLAAATSDVHGKLLFEAKAVQAGIERSGAMAGRLSFEYVGDWGKLRNRFEMKPGRPDKDNKPTTYAVPAWRPEDEKGLAIIVRGVPAGATEPAEDITYLAACHPRNSTLWATDPETQCRYRATRNWARKCLPGVMLGAITSDEYEPPAEINVTPAGSDRPAPESRLKAKRAQAAEATVAPTPEAQGEVKAEAKPAAVPYKLEAAIAAMDAKGTPRDFLLAWLRHRGTLAANQGIADLPQDAIAYMVEHPDDVARAVSEFADKQG